MSELEEILQRKFLHNTVEDYLIFAGIILVGGLILRLFRNIVLARMRKWAEKTETTLDDAVVHGIEKFLLPILNLGLLYYALTYLDLSKTAQKAVNAGVQVVLTYYGIRIITSMIRKSLESYVSAQEDGDIKVKQIRGITVVVNIAVWMLGSVLLINNLGYNVTAIITGLGIGGIAIALAAQNILGDLFNYFVIFFDRPVEIGDFIVINDKKGTVEHIGLKTTRVRSLSGEQLIMSNSALTGSWIHNFKRMERRRIVFTIGVIYETPAEQIKIIPGLLKQIIDDQAKATYDRAHFAVYGNFSLNYEVVYFVESPDYNEYMDIQQAINYRIFDEFTKRGIQFAYPTQKVFIEKSGD